MEDVHPSSLRSKDEKDDGAFLQIPGVPESTEVPEVREDVKRKSTIKIEYYDRNFVKHTDTFSDIRARVIQHEYDHIEGILFTDHLSALKKKIVKGKLQKIANGEVAVSYKMRFPK